MSNISLIHRPVFMIRALILVVAFAIVYLLKLYFYDNIYRNFELEIKNPSVTYSEPVTITYPLISSFSDFDGLCHKDELNSLIGKKMLLEPRKVEVVYSWKYSAYKEKGTYIEIDKNRIVKGIYCIK